MTKKVIKGKEAFYRLRLYYNFPATKTTKRWNKVKDREVDSVP